MALVFRTNLIHRNIRVMLLFIKSIILLRRNSGSLNKRMACGLQAWMCDLIHRASIDKFCWWGRSLKCSLHSFNFLSVRWICALCSLPLSLFCPFRCKLILCLLAVFPKDRLVGELSWNGLKSEWKESRDISVSVCHCSPHAGTWAALGIFSGRALIPWLRGCFQMSSISRFWCG